MTLTTRVNRINLLLTELGNYHGSIPLDRIFAIVRDYGFEPIQEDGTSWSGLLLGRESRTTIPLRDESSGKVSRWLALSWYKMDKTGRFEVVTYVS
jgi:hypothetical protein